MSKFLNKVKSKESEAIPLKGPVKEKGDTFQDKIDFLSNNFEHLFGDYNFSDAFNSQVHILKTGHSIYTDNYSVKDLLKNTLKVLAAVKRVEEELQWLYREKKLAKTLIEDEDFKKYYQTAIQIVKYAPQIKKLLDNLDNLESDEIISELNMLGFKEFKL